MRIAHVPSHREKRGRDIYPTGVYLANITRSQDILVVPLQPVPYLHKYFLFIFYSSLLEQLPIIW
jgi:hypothetical protein